MARCAMAARTPGSELFQGARTIRFQEHAGEAGPWGALRRRMPITEQREAVMNTKKQWLARVLVAVGLLGSQVWAANTDSKDATITVTPVANVTMTLSPNTYDFGNIDVNTSTTSAIPMVLANTGNIDIGVTAEIQGNDSASNWVADTSSATVNHYLLFVATSSFVPAANGSQFGVNNLLGKATGNTGTPIALRGLGGNSASP